MFQTPTLLELRQRFRKLGLDHPQVSLMEAIICGASPYHQRLQIGVDDHFSNPKHSSFVDQYATKTQGLLATGGHSQLYELCQQ